MLPAPIAKYHGANVHDDSTVTSLTDNTTQATAGQETLVRLWKVVNYLQLLTTLKAVWLLVTTKLLVTTLNY